MKEILRKFEVWLRANGYADNTIVGYLRCVSEYLKSINDQEMTEDNVNEFILQVSKTHRPGVVNIYLNALGLFFKFLKKDIKTPKHFKVDETIPDSFPLEFLEKTLIPTAEELFEDYDKVKVLLYFLFYSCLRHNEVVNLKREQFDLDKHTVKVYKGKQKLEQLVLYPARVATMLRNYFISEPEELNAFNLHPQGLKYIMRKLAENVKEFRIRAHLFKHSGATYLWKMTGDIFFVQGCLGHKRVQTTQRYVRGDIQARKEIYDKKIK